MREINAGATLASMGGIISAITGAILVLEQKAVVPPFDVVSAELPGMAQGDEVNGEVLKV